ncbi:MAG: hypothetical protein KAI79_03010 [Bacteroidales bacterium]|nr:hypothetical protein [Bacteroidales bacterium]
MKNWIVVKSYERLQQAQFRKSLLEQNDIEAVVFVKKDSAFLLGNIELMVKSEDLNRTSEILNEFSGWTQIIRFTRKKPLEVLDEIFQQSEIETMLTTDFDSMLNASIFELYVRVDKAQDIQSWLKSPKNWNLLTKCNHTKFLAYYYDILEKYKIEAIITSSINEISLETDYLLYVQPEKYDFARNLLAELRGWTVIHSPKNKDDAEKWVDFLEENNIPTIFEQESEYKNYYLYTQLEFENEATQLVNDNRDWMLAISFSDFHKAMLAKNILSQQNIDAIIMTKRDSAFLLGDIELYIEKEKLSEAKQILIEINKFESTEYEE